MNPFGTRPISGGAVDLARAAAPKRTGNQLVDRPTLSPTPSGGQGLDIQSPYTSGGLYYNNGGSIPTDSQQAQVGAGGSVLGVSTVQTAAQRQAAAQAAAEARARQNNLNTINTAEGQIVGSGNQAFDSIFNRYNTGARTLVDTIRAGQEGIDRSRQNVELDKLNSLSGLSQQIRQGLQSGNIRLAGMGASDSSGADQLARAYQQIGTQQGNSIFNEAALGNREIGFDQDALDLQASEGARQLEVFKEEEKNRVGFDVENKLLALDEQARGLGLEGQVQVQQIKQQIIDEGIARLMEIDNYLKQGLGGIAPQSQDAVQAEAQQLRTVGRPQGGFDFGNLQAQGPANTGFSLPLLGANRQREER